MPMAIPRNQFSASLATTIFLLVLFSYIGASSRQLDHGPSFETALLVFVRTSAFPCVLLVTVESSQGHEPLARRVMTSVSRV